MGLTVLAASIVIAVLDSEDAHHTAARAGLASRLEALDTFAVPVSAYAETLVGAFRKGEAAVTTVESFLAALPARVEAATPVIGRHAARLRAQHGRRLPLPDALVVATAIEIRAERVLTTDRRWPEVGVRVEIL
ncbi:MAG: type II toxin-antitoxin system VapC family toxin [Chloroflexi bacterium]|nr:MAG: type II toxin-antitoxin system VapC family toxin [Chloroflexota bacterium]